MTAFVLICEPGNYLQITPARYGSWRELADAYGVIYWNRSGMVRIVSNAVLDNALHIFADYTRMVGEGRLLTVPQEAARILWEQADATKNSIGPQCS